MPHSPKPGTLKVFLGMCPGVGKTYAMLEAARALQKQGKSVAIGIVETHQRKETAALLEGLEILPLAEFPHRGTQFHEFDLDAMLNRHPQIAIVDELAHTNAPGSRHPKRWQDVAELLNAGIDVLTTLNIQHLESRSDVVTAITQAPVRETIPDSFLDRAQEIELIDLTPRDLRKRLEEGKVYLGDQAKAAANHFFKESHLTALRQIALRYTAERVGVDLKEFQTQRRDQKTWRTAEKLMVAVGPSPFSPSLIRRARAIAGALDAPWSAIAVTTDEPLSPQEQESVTLHLSLARQLGAETATLEATSLIDGLLIAARERRVTQIVIGKSARHPWRDRLFQPPALRLLQQSGDIDVIAIEPGVSPNDPAEKTPSPAKNFTMEGATSELVRALAIAILSTFIGLACSSFLNASDIALLMLCGVIVGALFLRSTGTLALAVFTGLGWNFFFAPPKYTLTIHSSSDVTMFCALTIAAVTMGYLSNRIHRRERSVSRQQTHYSRLLEINTILTSSHDTEDTVQRSIFAVTSLFQFPCAIQLRSDRDHSLESPHAASTLHLSEKERSVAIWAFEKKQTAGKGTHTLTEAAALHLPLLGRSFVMGILSIDPGERALPLGERDQLASIAAQLGLALERNHLLRAIHHAEFLERSDQLRRSLLDHVSHELRTPVAVIGSSIDALEQGHSSIPLLPEMRSAQNRLRRVVDQLVESARVESGAVQAHPEWCDLLDLLETAQQRCAEFLTQHSFQITIEPCTPSLLLLDGELLLTALENLIVNACNHTPSGSSISVDAAISDKSELLLHVRDNGPGLENASKLFDRFHRGSASRPGGLGLGLSIVRGLIRGMGGQVDARNQATGGAEFSLRLPVKTTDSIPDSP
ncbi:MAG: DUF4118 domain-containing protein [Luteolibacter sp.]